MKFFLGIGIVIIVCMAGLFLYGQALEPDVRVIEIEVEVHETNNQE